MTTDDQTQWLLLDELGHHEPAPAAAPTGYHRPGPDGAPGAAGATYRPARSRHAPAGAGSGAVHQLPSPVPSSPGPAADHPTGSGDHHQTARGGRGSARVERPGTVPGAAARGRRPIEALAPSPARWTTRGIRARRLLGGLLIAALTLAAGYVGGSVLGLIVLLYGGR